MIRALWGRCGGAAVAFSERGGRWEAAVPAAPDAVYVLELWAEDEAGNRGYFATVKYAFDTARLCADVTILEVGGLCAMDEVRAALLGGVESRAALAAVSAALSPEAVESRVVRCEVCGR